MATLLETINDPADLRRLPRTQLAPLADELRAYVLESVARTGGHLSSNLGTVELTIALHYVYNTPHDRIVWDVGHQTYPHKILTGRRERMPTLRQLGGLAGFPQRAESEYDTFGTAHSSTSISAALGMAVAARQKGEQRHCIAVIGDGAMTAGMAFEALNNAGVADTDLLVILNDNDMSISPPVGALNRYFAQLMSGRFYAAAKDIGKKVLHVAPPLFELAKRIEEHAKGMVVPATLFEKFGFNYVGPIDGHDLESLIPTLQNIKPAAGARSSCTWSRRRARATSWPRPTRWPTTDRASSIRPWAWSSRPRRPSRPSSRCSASGCATWRRRTTGWWASRPRCAKAPAWWSSTSASRTATTTSASPNSTR
jgi:1-deoxy-D-xylulose-5-phosphate synthase